MCKCLKEGGNCVYSEITDGIKENNDFLLLIVKVIGTRVIESRNVSSLMQLLKINPIFSSILLFLHAILLPTILLHETIVEQQNVCEMSHTCIHLSWVIHV